MAFVDITKDLNVYNVNVSTLMELQHVLLNILWHWENQLNRVTKYKRGVGCIEEGGN